MDIVRPTGEQHLDDLVSLCNREFSDGNSYTDSVWKEYIMTLASPWGELPQKDNWAEQCLPSCALYLIDEDRFIGFSFFNHYAHSGKEFLKSQVQGSIELREHGELSQKTGGSIRSGVLKYFERLKDCTLPHINITLPDTRQTIEGVEGDDQYLFWIAVEEEYRNAGLGTMLLKETCKELAERGHTRLFSHAANPASERLHAKAGFESLLKIHPYYASLGGTMLMGKHLQEG